MSTNPLYTLSGNAQAEKRIREHLEIITQTIVSDMPKASIRSLILLGGYGKGEGGVSIVGNEYKPHNNFDLLLVTCDLNKKKRENHNKRLATKLQALGNTLEIGIDLSILDQAHLEKMPTRVLWYDMKHGHKTLFGDNHFIPSINHLRQNIPSWDIRNLMVNRGSLLLINLVCLQKEDRSERINRLIIKHAMKAIIGYGDALLYFLDQYHWSYREKHKRLLKHPEIDLKFKRLYDEAMSFRMSPKYHYYLQKDLSQWHRDVVHHLEAIHLRCESLRLGIPAMNWDQYLETSLRFSLLERGFSLKEIMRKILNLGMHKHGRLPKQISLMNRIAYRLADKESILPLIFPYIAFNPGTHSDKTQLIEFLTSHFNKEPSESLLNMIKAYLRQWGSAFDHNLRSVLLKHQIAL